MSIVRYVYSMYLHCHVNSVLVYSMSNLVNVVYIAMSTVRLCIRSPLRRAMSTVCYVYSTLHVHYVKSTLCYVYSTCLVYSMCLQNAMSTACVYRMSCLQYVSTEYHVYRTCLQNTMSTVRVYRMSCLQYVSTEYHVYRTCLQNTMSTVRIYRTLSAVCNSEPTNKNCS